jgi:hypothetical protein
VDGLAVRPARIVGSTPHQVKGERQRPGHGEEPQRGLGARDPGVGRAEPGRAVCSPRFRARRNVANGA